MPPKQAMKVTKSNHFLVIALLLIHDSLGFISRHLACLDNPCKVVPQFGIAKLVQITPITRLSLVYMYVIYIYTVYIYRYILYIYIEIYTVYIYVNIYIYIVTMVFLHQT